MKSAHDCMLRDNHLGVSLVHHQTRSNPQNHQGLFQRRSRLQRRDRLKTGIPFRSRKNRKDHPRLLSDRHPVIQQGSAQDHQKRC